MATEYGIAMQLKGLNYPKLGDTIVWDGKNTEDVVRFCYYYMYELCGCYQTHTNDNNMLCALTVEPADTIRHSSFSIRLGQTLTASLSNNGVTAIVKASDYRYDPTTTK